MASVPFANVCKLYNLRQTLDGKLEFPLFIIGQKRRDCDGVSDVVVLNETAKAIVDRRLHVGFVRSTVEGELVFDRGRSDHINVDATLQQFVLEHTNQFVTGESLAGWASGEGDWFDADLDFMVVYIRLYDGDQLIDDVYTATNIVSAGLGLYRLGQQNDIPLIHDR